VGLFSKKTDEEVAEIAKQKNRAKENQAVSIATFKGLVKGAKPYFIKIIQDSSNEAGQTITLYVHKNGRSYLQYTKTGQFTSTKELTEYNVVNFEWLEEIENKGKKVIGRAVLGSLLAGPAGMIIGGVTGKNKTKDHSTAVLSLQNVENKSVRMFSFKCDQSNMKKYKTIPRGSLITKEETPIFENVTIEKSVAEQIKEFKELLDIEAITQEEFDKKKTELLNM